MRSETIEFTNKIPVKVFAGSVRQYPYHWHDALEIIMVLKGSVRICMSDDNLLLRENDVAVVNMGELHRFTGNGQDNEILFIQIDHDFCQRVLPDDGYLFIWCCSVYREAHVPEKYTALREYIVRLVRAFNQKSHGEWQKNIESLLSDMLAYLFYHFDFLRWGYGTTPFDEKYVKRLKQMAVSVSGDHEVKLGLKALAADANVSFYHLSRDIKAKFGLTFQELLHIGKCLEAAKLLLNTKARIVDIALECGFSDTKYLIKYFKQYYKCTPSQFRRMYRADDADLAAQVQYRDVPLSAALVHLLP